MQNQEIFPERISLQPLQGAVANMKKEVSKVIVGQDNMVELLIVAILSNGHVLLEGVPGIAKTLTAKVLARLISAEFSRIQFTPDLMPADITGTSVFNQKKGVFEFNQGPIFSNIVLIDEINRAPAKTQSALFEVMEERQVTVDGKTYPMGNPFLVFATQNPLEHEGTYRLPEAQLDRFYFKINVTYPSIEEETMILQKTNDDKDSLIAENISPVLKPEQLKTFRELITKVHVEENLIRYIAEVITKTRTHPALYLGASPRASICTLNSCKSLAAMNGRDFVIPEDIKTLLVPVLNHRLYLTPEKELEGTSEKLIIEEIIGSTEIPR